MNRTCKQSLIVAALALLLLASGCGATSAQRRLDDATIAYTAALNVASDLRDAGLIDDATLLRLAKVRGLVAKALDAAQAAITAGKERDIAISLQQADLLLGELMRTGTR